MKVDWYAERYRLRQLRTAHPEWSLVRLSEETEHSYNWVKKWVKRTDQADPEDDQVLHGQSRAPKNGPHPISAEVVKEILTIRDEPPEGLQRIPGPEAIKYYLHRNQDLPAAGHYLPTSTSTIWRILAENGRIARPHQADHVPLTRNQPMAVWELDFKDVGTILAEPGGKLMHLVETLNMVDTGTSILVDNPASDEFHAVTVIDSVVDTLRREGLPKRIRFDRDPRFIGSWTADDFPSPFMRLLLNLGIEVDVCPPRQPWLNPYVERYNRTYEYEGIRIYRPETLPQTIDMNRDLKYHYNYKRPNQALTCGNQPPRVAFPELPSLPQLPEIIDPDGWLSWVDGKLFQRRVKADGTVQLGKQHYYVSRAQHKQTVQLKIDAPNRQLQVLLDGQDLKAIPLKGLHGGLMPFDTYLDLTKAEALSEWQLYKRKAKRYVRLVA